MFDSISAWFLSLFQSIGWDEATVSMMLWGIFDSIYMTVGSSLFAYLLGFPLGILLVTSAEGGIRPCRPLFRVLDVVINITRSIPFLILMVAVVPFTRLIVGTAIGATATIVPLVLAAAPVVARMVESSILEVDRGVIEAAQSMGSTNLQIIWKVMLPEARPSLINGAAIATTTILSYSAMAGAIGGGGLGAIAINYGYYRYEDLMMLISLVLLVVLVQILQKIGTKATGLADKRKVQ